MAYTKHTWENGEVISAEKLNNLEEGIGYDVVEEVLFEEEVTTIQQQSGASFATGNIIYSDFIDFDILNVVFNNVEYSLPKNVMGGGTNIYGEVNEESHNPVFNTYPLIILSSSNYRNQLVTSEPGTYNIKVKVQLIQTTAKFDQAVKKNGLKNIKDGEGNSAITEGSGTKAQGNSSHAEGGGTTASGNCSHAEGAGTTASGSISHAEGSGTKAQGLYSHAEGNGTTASGKNSHAGGGSTIAQGYAQTVIGQFNIAQGTSNSNTSTDYAFIIGNGNSNTRSNALAIKWDGTFVFANGTEITPAQFASILSSISS